PVATPLTMDVRAKMKLLGPMPGVKVRPTPYSDSKQDAEAFDSVPGPGFDTNPSAAAIVPPAGRLGGTGTALALDAAPNNAHPAVKRAWKGGASGQLRRRRYPACGV